MYVGIQACRSLIYLNTHSSIRARSTFTSSLSLPLFIYSSSSFVPFLSVLLVLSCCPCHYLSCSVITRSRLSTYLCSTVVVKMEALTSDLWSEFIWSDRASFVHSLFLASTEQNCVSGSFFGELQPHLCIIILLFIIPTSAGHKQ